eukprot:15468902-Alexandrium_andersonii.AAC.1
MIHKRHNTCEQKVRCKHRGTDGRAVDTGTAVHHDELLVRHSPAERRQCILQATKPPCLPVHRQLQVLRDPAA